MDNGTVAAPPERRRAALKSAAIGNFVEWYDFSLYGLFSTTIATVFFPKSDPTAAILATLAIFGVSFLARPLGGIVIGRIGDRAGRRSALLISVTVMSVATLAVGLLPTAGQVGILAPILLLVCRFSQGMAAGGEYGSSTSYMVEFAPEHHRGLYASITPVWSYIGGFTGVVVSLIITSSLTPEQLMSWGWRIAFLTAAPLGLAGLYLRLKVEESPVFEALRSAGHVEKSPLKETLKNSRRPLLIIIGWAMTNATAAYIMSTFLVSHLAAKSSFGLNGAIIIQLVLWSVLAVGTLTSGHLIDRLGRKRVAVTCSVGLAVLSVPGLALLDHSSVPQAALVMMVLALLYSGFTATTALALVELFPPAVRASGAALSYQVAYAIFGGSAPGLATWMVSRGFDLGPGIYLALLSTISTGAAIVGIGNRNKSSDNELNRSDDGPASSQPNTSHDAGTVA